MNGYPWCQGDDTPELDALANDYGAALEGLAYAQEVQQSLKDRAARGLTVGEMWEQSYITETNWTAAIEECKAELQRARSAVANTVERLMPTAPTHSTRNGMVSLNGEGWFVISAVPSVAMKVILWLAENGSPAVYWPPKNNEPYCQVGARSKVYLLAALLEVSEEYIG